MIRHLLLITTLSLTISIVSAKGLKFSLSLFERSLCVLTKKKSCFPFLDDFVAPKLGQFKPLESFDQGQKFKLLCYLLEGSKPIIFTWKKNDQILSSSSSTSIPSDSEQRYRIDYRNDDESYLTIQKLSIADAANYSCLARNRFGSSKQSIRLSVKGIALIWFLRGKADFTGNFCDLHPTVRLWFISFSLDYHWIIELIISMNSLSIAFRPMMLILDN